jgi:hypothetical protein
VFFLIQEILENFKKILELSFFLLFLFLQQNSYFETEGNEKKAFSKLVKSFLPACLLELNGV